MLKKILNNDKSNILSIGLMSGTSMDGIDASILKMTADGEILSEECHYFYRYSSIVRLLFKATEFAVKSSQGKTDLPSSTFCEYLKDYLNSVLKITNTTYIMNLFYDYIVGKQLDYNAVEKLSSTLHMCAVKSVTQKGNYSLKDIDVIGYHGQTLYHAPQHKITITMGDGYYMHKELGIPVVYQFRTKDVEEGGQGAPFAPLYHFALAIKKNIIPVGFINCGGIANTTIIPSLDENDIIAFDTGPANGLLDAFVRHKTQGLEFYDKDGDYAKFGKICPTALDDLWRYSICQNSDNYYLKSPPKSLDIGDLNLPTSVLNLSLHDGCATLAYFTSLTIVDSLKFIKNPPSSWVLVGGGWKNPAILQSFKNLMKATIGEKLTLYKASDLNLENDAVEANIFAYLAVRSLQQKPLSLPNTTGVKKPMTGGVLCG